MSDAIFASRKSRPGLLVPISGCIWHMSDDRQVAGTLGPPFGGQIYTVGRLATALESLRTAAHRLELPVE